MKNVTNDPFVSSFMKPHEIFVNEVSYMKNDRPDVTFSWMKFPVWNTHYSAGLLGMNLCVWKCHVWSIAPEDLQGTRHLCCKNKPHLHISLNKSAARPSFKILSNLFWPLGQKSHTDLLKDCLAAHGQKSHTDLLKDCLAAHCWLLNSAFVWHESFVSH